mgnify:CR=1 FL=1
MFCKLFKYDMKELWKKVWLMYFFLLITAMIARGTNLLGKQVSFFSYISTGASILLIIASIVIAIWAFITGIRHFYQKMLTDEGYLTHTLPTSPSTILTAKTLSMILMMAITIVVIIASVFITFYEKEAWEGMWNMANAEFAAEGLYLPYFLTFILSICALNLITTQLVIQCSLAIGHSFSQNKMGCSIGIAFGFYAAYQILNVIGLGATFLFKPNLLDIINETIPPNEILVPIFGVVATTLSVLSLVSIILTHHFMNNKLNLE